VNVLPWGIIENALGGAPTYAGFALVALGKSVGIVSKVGRDFPQIFPPIYSKMGLDTEGMMVTGEHTTTFENTYDEAGNRTQVCKHVVASISPADIPDAYRGAESFYVSPIVNEITPTLMKNIKRGANVVMLDPQGLFREIGKDGGVKFKQRDDLADFFMHVDIVKLGKEEAQALKGDTKEALSSLREMGPKIAILTRGERGCAVLSDAGFSEFPALKIDAKDLTGAGDVFGAAFLVRYQVTGDVAEAAKFANAAAGLKVRYKGPVGFPSEKEVLEAITNSGW
jgi:sugar/nucleoside kinase (ribokinase family)